MSDDDFEMVRGSGNVFRDLKLPNADVEQLKAALAARIIGALDNSELSVRQAHDLTGFAAADFSRVRQAKLDRFTIDRLLSMLKSLDGDLEITVSFAKRDEPTAKLPTAA